MNCGKRLHGTVAGRIGNLVQLSNDCAKTCNIYTLHLVVKHSNKFCNEVLFVFTSAIF